MAIFYFFVLYRMEKLPFFTHDLKITLFNGCTPKNGARLQGY